MWSPSHQNPEYRAGERLKRRIAIFCAAIIAAVSLLVIQAVIKERSTAFGRARVDAANLSAGFAEEIQGILNGVAGASASLKNHIEEEEAEGRSFDLKAWESKVHDLVSPTINIGIIDANGELHATTLEHDGRPVFYNDRDFFPAHRDNPGLGLFIGHPVNGKLAKRKIIPVTRRLNTPDGQFAGVLVFAIDPGLLTSLHREVDIGRTGRLNLFFNDGVVFAYYTSGQGLYPSLVGRKLNGLQFLPEAEHANSGTFVKTSVIDGTKRIYSWRKVVGYPLIGVAALGESEALADANRQARIVIALGVVAFGLCLTMIFILNGEISSRVRHAIARDEEAEKARQANQVKSDFLANVSHELRTPLNAVIGFAEIIRDKFFGNDVERYADYAGDIYDSGEHLLNIVNDILDLRKIEAGKLELREENIEVTQIIQECLAAIERQAATAGVAVTNTTPDVRAGIFGDQTKLKQIIINLISNAIKFTPSGGSVTIAIITEVDSGLSLKIEDTGIGMSSDEIKTALELFRQVDNSHSRRFQGTGLGLPLAVQLTELHGGTIEINSTPGRGTAIIVHFPASRVTWVRRQPHLMAEIAAPAHPR